MSNNSLEQSKKYYIIGFTKIQPFLTRLRNLFFPRSEFVSLTMVVDYPHMPWFQTIQNLNMVSATLVYDTEGGIKEEVET